MSGERGDIALNQIIPVHPRSSPLIPIISISIVSLTQATAMPTKRRLL
jgi:hypothetical protein